MITATTLTKRVPAPPRLAMVLGSGGVRSVAALGIAEVLAREGLCPDLLVGCSSGAIFAATIAMGMSGEAALEATKRLWSADVTQKRRWRAYGQILAPRLLGFDAGFSLRDASLIASRLHDAFGGHRIEDLPKTLRVVATATNTGEPVVLTRGSIAQALQASMAVPFLFPSVEIDGQRLCDGVISNPLPVSVAHDAHAVVALGFRGVMPRRIDRPSRLMAQVSTAMINNLQEAHIRAACAAGQRVLSLELDVDRRIGLWETAAATRIYQAGRRTAERRLNDIRALFAATGAQAA